MQETSPSPLQAAQARISQEIQIIIIPSFFDCSFRLYSTDASLFGDCLRSACLGSDRPCQCFIVRIFISFAFVDVLRCSFGSAWERIICTRQTLDFCCRNRNDSLRFRQRSGRRSFRLRQRKRRALTSLKEKSFSPLQAEQEARRCPLQGGQQETLSPKQ